jgi:hypothetical protein
VNVTSQARSSTLEAETISDRDERRWHAGSFVTLGYALFMALFNVGIVVYMMTIPSDGWLASTQRGSSDDTVLIGPEFLPVGAALQEGDEVTAVNGEPVTDIADRAYDFLNVVPPAWADGTVLRYDVRRGEESLTVYAPIRRITPREILSSSWSLAGDTSLQRLLAIAGPLSFFLVGLAVFLLRPGSRAAHALFLIGSAFIFNLSPGFPGLPVMFYPIPPSSVPFDTWTAVINPSLMYLALVFPRPKWLLRRYPRGGVVLLYLPWLLLFNINYLLHPGDRIGFYETAQVLYIVQIALLMVITIASLIHSTLTIHEPVARTQFKWLALGLFGFVIVGVGGWLVGFLIGDLSNPVFQAAQTLGQLGWFLLPVCLAVGITRYRMFDIDIIIRRTTSYAVITAFLALIYFGSIIVFQNLFGRVTGQNSNAAIVLSTLLIAALFGSVRRRVQDVIDRRFNRSRYDAEKTLARFATTVRDEPDLEKLTAELLNVIQETMQPASLSLWLRETAQPASGRESSSSGATPASSERQPASLERPA